MVELSPYKRWSVGSTFPTYKKEGESPYKNVGKPSRPKQVKNKSSSVYQRFSWGSRLDDISDMLQDAKNSYEERGWADLYVEVAISWAKDIHPNGPEPSSVVTWIRYDGENHILSFGLRQGGSREYDNVDFETAFAFTESDSKGRFVYRNGL
jgi:hypothetical protein